MTSGVGYWDDAAESFDQEPDHGLRDPAVRAAWRDLLLSVLPPAPARIADIGCGTGSVSLLLAEAGYDVTGLDFSAAMVSAAQAKAAAASAEARFVVGDASDPQLDDGDFDVVLCRHVLWALPDRDLALARWIALLAPVGWLVLVEGSWSTGAGLTAEQGRRSCGAAAMRPPSGCSATLGCGGARSPTSATWSCPAAERAAGRSSRRAPACRRTPRSGGHACPRA